ncbi:MAG: hypothetical protein B7X04_02070 [Parcubacteria group bacterium 21-54-25]|nr:MAG: hypothetical protein B7X04_02070 [Parcubacteria group bacterium 21-54-25]HQU07643.1 FKBP-type peptidyl-prolyl cis-trans isomerase [Candidatus Paceibacterota bacterium]
MNTSTGIAVALAIVVVVFGFFGQSIFAFFTGVGTQSSINQAVSVASTTGTTTSATPGSLSVVDTVVGTGAVAQPGDQISILYEGMLSNGTVFDSSQAHGNKPLPFTIGAHNVIPGMEEGVIGMKVGGQRTITIPPALGYGAQGNGPIPPNSTLIFKVQLVSVTPATTTPAQ